LQQKHEEQYHQQYPHYEEHLEKLKHWNKQQTKRLKQLKRRNKKHLEQLDTQLLLLPHVAEAAAASDLLKLACPGVSCLQADMIGAAVTIPATHLPWC
jgi:demethoxyubiquinone hydroxylase (CLK1/Coq7/Cat5 family)